MNKFIPKQIMYKTLNQKLRARELGRLKAQLDSKDLSMVQYTAAVDELDILFEGLDTFEKLVKWNESL